MAGKVELKDGGEMAPAKDAFSITPNDSVDLEKNTRGLWVGVSGTVKVDTVGGDTVSFVGVQGVLPVQCTRVYSTGTDATDIVGLY